MTRFFRKAAVCLALCAVILLAGTVFLITNGTNPIEEINSNSVLPYPLTLAEGELQHDDSFRRIEGYGGYVLEKEGIMFWMSGWPDVLDEYHLTEYRFTSKEYSVLGITIGDSIASAVSKLSRYNYRQGEAERYYSKHTKGNKAVEITLYFDENSTINEIWITAVSSNKEGVAF